MIPKIIRSLYYILFFTVPLIVISSTSELFELNKMLVVYAAALTVFCCAAADLLLSKKKLLRRTPLDIPLMVFFAVLAVSTVFSIDRHTSVFGYYGRFNGGLLSILSFIVLYYGIVWYFRKADVLNLLRVSVATSFIVILWGLSGKLGHDLSCFVFTGKFDNSCWTDQFRPAERMFSTLGQPNWLGAYLSAEFFVAAYLYLNQAKKKVSGWYASIPYGVYLIFNFMCILFSRSRSALIAWVAGAVIFAGYFLVRRRKETLKPFASIGIVCLVVILLFKTGIDKVDKFITLPSNTKAPKTNTAPAPQLSSEVTESFDIRRIVWKGAWELGLRYPVLGTGPETFAYSYYFTRPAEHNMTSEWDYIYNKAHNEYMNYLATTGFTGLIAYLAVICTALGMLIRKLIRDDKTSLLTLSVLCAYTTVLITNFFGFSTSTVQLLLYLLPAMWFVTVHDTKPVESEYAETGFKQYAGLGGIALIFIVSAIWLIQFFRADLKYAQAVGRMQQGEYQTAARLLSEALTIHYEHIYEEKLSTALANVALVSAYSDKPDLSRRFITLSRHYIDHAIQQSPQNMMYWKTKGKNEYTFYQASPDQAYIDEAIKDLYVAYKLAPTDPKQPYTLGLLYGALNQKDNSLKFLDRTVELKPDYQEAYILKLKLLKSWKENQQANSLEQLILNKFPALTKESLDKELQ